PHLLLSLRAAPPSPPPYTTLFRSEGDPGLAVEQLVERHIGRVAAVAVRHDVVVRGLDVLEDLVERHPAPRHLELRPVGDAMDVQDRKSTRLNSSHVKISYAVFCVK